MKLSAAFFALVPLVAAMPPAARTVEAGTDAVSPKPNVLGNVLVCVDPNFGPPCATFHGANMVGSADAKPSEPNCVGRQLVVRAPGIADFATVGFDDVIMSFNSKAFIEAFITKLKNPRLPVGPDNSTEILFILPQRCTAKKKASQG
ncbi:hypothetical protein C8J57DRAFT_1473772 [Mycena rebaudengoi]|nr:hypothetical protein C8J57DRAFT_1473772 [Mycena rebaudengoi]